MPWWTTEHAKYFCSNILRVYFFISYLESKISSKNLIILLLDNKLPNVCVCQAWKQWFLILFPTKFLARKSNLKILCFLNVSSSSVRFETKIDVFWIQAMSTCGVVRHININIPQLYYVTMLSVVICSQIFLLVRPRKGSLLDL